MQSSAARVLEEYESSREYHAAPRETAPALQVKEGRKRAEGISPLPSGGICNLDMWTIHLS